MRKLEDVKYLHKLNEAKPDANQSIRFVTEYLSFIEGVSKLQTTDGVIHLVEPYAGKPLKHNDPIVFMGRMLAGEYLEGFIKPITREAVNKFKEYALILKNKG
jgi:hypothetical protein